MGSYLGHSNQHIIFNHILKGESCLTTATQFKVIAIVYYMIKLITIFP
jgi:hypothetical protein